MAPKQQQQPTTPSRRRPPDRLFAGNGAGVSTGNLSTGAIGAAMSKSPGKSPGKANLRLQNEREKELFRIQQRRRRLNRLAGVDIFDPVDIDVDAEKRKWMDEFVPREAYGSHCPVHLGCDLRPRGLPGAKDPLVQQLCGNPTDLVTRDREGEAERERAMMLPMKSGEMLGYPTPDERGWYMVHDPPALTKMEIRTPEEKEMYMCCLDIFGITSYRRVTVMGGTADAMCLTIDKDEIPATVPEVKRALQVILKVEHANVVQLLDVCEDDEHIFLLYEDCAGCASLPMRIHRGQWLSEAEAARMMQELAAAITSCSRSNLALLDWSVWNCMCTTMKATSPMKIFGVGLAGVLYGSALSNGEPADSPLRAAYFYHAPELCKFENQGVQNPYKRLLPQERRHVDVWSVGAILIAGLTGRAPSCGMTPQEVRQNIILGEYHQIQNRISAVGEDGVVLIQRALCVNPTHRPSSGSIVAHPWVMTQTTQSGAFVASSCVDRLMEYVRQPKMQKAIGRLLADTLSEDKRRFISGIFRSVDVRGDGSVDDRELVAVAAHRRHDIKEIWKKLPGGKQDINEYDFMLANIFTDGVLSERMLADFFFTVDVNNSGSISAGELYALISTVQPDLTLQELCDFLAEVDEDMSLTLNYKEFRSLFPVTRNRQKELDENRQRVVVRMQLCRETYDTLLAAVKKWIYSIRKAREKLYQYRLKNQEKEFGGTVGLVNDVEGMLRWMRGLMAKMPRNRLPPEAAELLGLRRIKRPPQEEAGGVFALDLFLKENVLLWTIALGKLESDVREVSIVESQELRQMAMDELIPKALQTFSDVMLWTEQYSEEQTWSFEAQDVESTFPTRPWARKGLIHLAPFTEDDKNDLKDAAKSTLVSKQQGIGKFGDGGTVERKAEHATLYTLAEKLRPAIAHRLGFGGDPYAGL